MLANAQTLQPEVNDTVPTDQAMAGEFILVADDDPILTETMQIALTGMGAERVIVASDGLQAHEALLKYRDMITLIVLDLRMPNEDGVGFLRRAAEVAYEGRIIVISGEQPEILKGAERLGRLLGLECVGAYRKPFHPMMLINALTTHKNQSKTRRLLGGERPYRLDHMTYQPRIDVKTLKLAGAEALARFTDTDGRPYNTELAIVSAENSGSVGALTIAIIEKITNDLRSIRQELNTSLPMSLNISSLSASRSGFADDLEKRIVGAGYDPSSFIIELTETQLSSDVVTALENLTRLRLKDFGLALDDFGTGHANIDQLANFPFTELKIDKRFIMRAEHDRFAATCAEAAVEIGKSMKLTVVAEGVEDQWGHDFISNLGVDLAQGYFYSKPLSGEDLVAFGKQHL